MPHSTACCQREPFQSVPGFVQAKPGKLENHGNEYLHYQVGLGSGNVRLSGIAPSARPQDDWYVLDHGDEDDPELGFAPSQQSLHLGQLLACASKCCSRVESNCDELHTHASSRVSGDLEVLIYYRGQLPV